MIFKDVFKRLPLLPLALLAIPAIVHAGPGGKSILECVLSRIETEIEAPAARTKHYRARVDVITRECKERRFNLCRDPSFTEMEKDLLIHAAAHLDDAWLREKFFQSFPKKNEDDLARLLQYAERRVKFCDPPLHETCSSERWELVFEDYMARTGDVPNARYLRRWDELAKRVPGLADFVKESPPFSATAKQVTKYQDILFSPGLSADSMSIISEQSAKKRLNDVNKALSDALGSTRLRMFRQHLQKNLEAEGLSLPTASRVDFKTDRMLEPIIKLRDEHPKRLEQAVNDAAKQADAEFTDLIQTRFPELMYVSATDNPARWFNTASFSMPGYPARLNETLASFKARKMRTGPVPSNEQARDEFVTLADQVIQSADTLKTLDAEGNGRLVKAGVIENNGTFTRKTAELIRKLPSESKLAATLADVFHGIQLTEQEQGLILQQWKAQDLLSIPLSTIDQMGSIPKDVALLGGDGIGGGAIDAWSKVTALMDHRKMIARESDPNNRVKRVFNALVEGDKNASKIIRTAPLILKEAVESLPVTTRKKLGISEAMVSADDAIVPLGKLIAMKPADRDKIYQELTLRISESNRSVLLTRNGFARNLSVGPELLRAFLGYNKESAEAAETFIKPFEERIAKADFLGPNWRKKYPKIAFLSVKDNSDQFQLYIGGASLDDALKAKFKEALKASVHDASGVELHFVSATKK